MNQGKEVGKEEMTSLIVPIVVAILLVMCH